MPNKKNEGPEEDWPMLEGNLENIIENRKSPSELSRKKLKSMKMMLRMPKDQLRTELIKEINEEVKFLQSHNNLSPSQQPIYRPSSIATQFLVMNDIKPLKKRSTKFQRAQYFCHLCEYHCDTLEICIHHIEDTRHSRLAKKQELETTLYHLPRPNRKHIEALDHLLARVEANVGLSDQELAKRQAIASRVNEILKTTVQGSFVRSYGSSMTGIGLKDSGLNLDLQIPSEIPPHEALIMAFRTLVHHAEEFTHVTPDFTAKIPIISFFVGEIRCELSLNNTLAYQTSALLRDYVSIDPRAKTLLVCLRFWAHICKLDRQAEGTLPPHSFALLMIYYLQRLRQPLLPCIHEFIELGDNDVYETPKEKLSQWRTENRMSVAELWIEFFEHYALGVLSSEYVISIRSTKSCTRVDKQWKGNKVMAIEDPFSTKRSLTRSVNSLRVLDFIADCFRIAYLYFGTVQTKLGPIVTKVIVPPSSKITKQRQKEPEKRDEDTADLINKLNLDDVTPMASRPLPGQAITLEELEKSLMSTDAATPSDEEEEDEEDFPGPGESFEAFAQRIGTELSPKQAQKITELVPKNMISFMFDGDILTAGQSPILVCTVCNNEGHLQNKCPEEQLPPVVSLPPLIPGYRELLNAICNDVMQCRIPSTRELAGRDNVVKDLTDFVRKFYPEAVLTVFGSSVNGFSFSKSDLDISLTFRDFPTDEDVDVINIIENLAAQLEKKREVLSVQAITTAKVPILKLQTTSPRLEVDVSLYNLLAAENTRMLRTYTTIDSRVKVLGYVVKEFAKKSQMCDASRGSLSSYAYILMLIYYLQQVQPPVVPVLQELYDPSKERPVKIVDGWNAWFYSDVQNMKTAWPALGANKMSIAELWLGFLDFYANSFDDARLVVSIRMKKKLGKFEKMWNSPCIAIEDPFDLSHNLGAGISRKMHIFIKSSFIKTRELFGIPTQRIPRSKNVADVRLYFFDPNRMTDGSPPNDRGCRACGKIGHLVRDCPKKKAADENKKANKKGPIVKNQQQGAKLASSPETPTVPKEKKEMRHSGLEGPDLIALLQSGGGFQQLPPMPITPMNNQSGLPLPALPNSAISVEDLERNMVNPGPPKDHSLLLTPQGLSRMLPPPSFEMFCNQPPSLGLSSLAAMGGNQPWPSGVLGFPLGAPPPAPPPGHSINSFGLGAPPHPLGMFGGPSLGGAPGFQRPPSPPQEKPLQLNQLPSFNLFNGPCGGLFDMPQPPTTGNNDDKKDEHPLRPN